MKDMSQTSGCLKGVDEATGLVLAKVRPEALLSWHLGNPPPPAQPPTSSLPGVKMQESVQKSFCKCLNVFSLIPVIGKHQSMQRCCC